MPPVLTTGIAPSWPTQQMQPYRACAICTHKAMVEGQLMCARREVVAPAQHLPVDLVRRPGGSCGPDAWFLDFPGLHQR